MLDKRLPASDSPVDTQSDISTERGAQSDRPETPVLAPDAGSEWPREYGGRKGLDPVRYGDWEKNGRCIDF